MNFDFIVAMSASMVFKVVPNDDSMTAAVVGAVVFRKQLPVKNFQNFL
jgi:hypothetical protein